jgi:hypothetical protein
MVRTDAVDLRLLGDLIGLAWRFVAPARLVDARHPGQEPIKKND